MGNLDHDVKESTLENTQETSGQIAVEPGPAASKPWRRKAFLGGVWLVVAAVSTSWLAFGIARAFVYPRSRSGLPYILPVFAVLAGLSIWAGIKRRPHWEFFLAGTFTLLAALQLASRITLSAGGRVTLAFSKAQLIAILIMAAVAAGLFLLGLAKRRRVEGFSGGAGLVVAAVSTYQVVFIIALAFIGPRSWKGFRYPLLVYAVLAVLSIWAGIRRRPRWQFFLAGTFAVFAALQLPSLVITPAGWRGFPALSKAQGIAIIVMAVLAVALFLLGMAKRRRPAGASPS